jgi:hypothetical protein
VEDSGSWGWGLQLLDVAPLLARGVAEQQWGRPQLLPGGPEAWARLEQLDVLVQVRAAAAPCVQPGRCCVRCLLPTCRL